MTSWEDLAPIVEAMGSSLIPQENAEYFTSRWSDLVVLYSQRALTKSSDKLVALSALARRFSMLTKAPYLAGIWLDQDTIADQLMWNVTLSKESNYNYDSLELSLPCVCDACFNTLYRAPTWSWASVDVPVTCMGKLSSYYERISRLFKIVEWHCPTGLDSFGQASSVWLQVKGRVGTLKQTGATQVTVHVEAAGVSVVPEYCVEWPAKGKFADNDFLTEETPPIPARFNWPTERFFGSRLSCDRTLEVNGHVFNLLEDLHIIPTQTNAVVHIPTGTVAEKMTAKFTKSISRKLYCRTLRVLVCREGPADGDLRTFRRVGVMELNFDGKLHDLAQYNSLSSEEFLLVS